MRLRSMLVAGVFALAMPVAASASTIVYDGSFIPNGNKFGDIFTLNLGPGVLTATTDFSQTYFGIRDTQLFFFDNTWHGVASDDEIQSGQVYSGSSAISKNLSGGTYYLIVSQFNADPLSGWLEHVFPDQTYQWNCPTDCSSNAYDGTWDPGTPIDTGGDYRLSLTHPDSFVLDDPIPATVPAPEPASLALLTTGALGMLARFRRRRSA